MTKAGPHLIDIVIPVSGSLGFLDKWRSVLQPYHIIVVQSGVEPLSIPDGFNISIYKVSDAKKILGDDAWCLINSDGSLNRSFGYMMSQKKYVYTFDEGCLCASDPSGKQIDALAEHLLNLTSPATPFFFNTLYDPYRPGTDFVRGYPFSLREGVATAVSHGLWLNMPDYDTATALVKPLERNTRYVDAALTVPKGVLYPMSSINLAFDREAIGASMYSCLSILEQPAVEMWSGWCAKVISDHLGHGHKTGLPYIWKSEKPMVQLVSKIQEDSKVILWQEEMVPFFSQLKLSPQNNTAELAYIEIANKVKEELGPKEKYFSQISDAMICWVRCWKSVNK
jgi:reversibly glycosylated polypeptide/UDP-arabinopyranose mutase